MQDLTDAYLHIGADVEAAVSLLLENPQAGAPREFRSPSAQDIRSWMPREFPNYLIFYRVSGHDIEIVRFLHGARDLPRLILAPDLNRWESSASVRNQESCRVHGCLGEAVPPQLVIWSQYRDSSSLSVPRPSGVPDAKFSIPFPAQRLVQGRQLQPAGMAFSGGTRAAKRQSSPRGSKIRGLGPRQPHTVQRDRMARLEGFEPPTFRSEV